MTESIKQTHATTCCIVGGGPAGVVLGYLLARKNVPVLLLESHPDFDRDFRGDTVHPTVMEVMDQLGLADRLLELPHARVQSMTFTTPAGKVQIADLSRLKTRFNYVTMLPQVRFLEFLAAEAKKFPSFQLIMRANVQELIEENGVVKGIRFRDAHNDCHEVRALLTVGADGRFSRLRKLAGFEPIRTSPPMDVLWFRLPRQAEDAPASFGGGFIGKGHMLVLLDRGDEWQAGYVIPKGSYQKLKAAGLEELRRVVADLAPFLADNLRDLRDWSQVNLLSVESSRLPRWYRPGLLLIGDAAHVMSPVGGVGINYAIMDAVAAANLLAAPLRAGKVSIRDLAAVQQRRQWPTRIIQALQARLQTALIARALAARGGPFRLPWLMRWIPRLPFLRDLPARLVGFGIRPERVEN